LKVVSKIMKDWKKKKVQYGFEYLWGWFDNDWKDSNYVKQLADMPSKEELVGKFMFMMNYPVQSFVQVLDQIAKKKWE
jgi:ribosomal protein L10